MLLCETNGEIIGCWSGDLACLRNRCESVFVQLQQLIIVKCDKCMRIVEELVMYLVC